MITSLAVENVGRDVLLVRDNKVIGEGRTQTSDCTVVSVEMVDDRAKALVDSSPMVQVLAVHSPDRKYRWALFHFHAFTGRYADLPEDGDLYFADLENVRVVDKLNFEYGLVPDSFKEVEGYRAVINKTLEEIKNEDSSPDPSAR